MLHLLETLNSSGQSYLTGHWSYLFIILILTTLTFPSSHSSLQFSDWMF